MKERDRPLVLSLKYKSWNATVMGRTSPYHTGKCDGVELRCYRPHGPEFFVIIFFKNVVYSFLVL